MIRTSLATNIYLKLLRAGQLERETGEISCSIVCTLQFSTKTPGTNKTGSWDFCTIRLNISQGQGETITVIVIVLNITVEGPLSHENL